MFDSKKEIKKIIKFIKDYYKENKLGGVVIGISGGKDSAVVAALFTKALGSENVLGISMPCYSKKDDYELAKLLCDYYDIELIKVDLSDTFDTFKKQINYDDKYLVNSDLNLKPRLRMATLYYYSALYSSLKNKTYIVAGTGNKSEGYVGYFTKGGDSLSDIRVISDFTVEEVIKLGEELNVPKELLYRTPSDGLNGMSDEEKLGITYSDIDKYINGKKVAKNISEIIEKLHKNSLHKFNIPTYIK